MGSPSSPGADGRQLPKARAYNYIREQIVTGAWPAGHRLQPERIAQELGVSRMPVRDAIAQLDGEGIVTLRPHQAAIVTILPPEEIFELYEIRAALEGLAARKAAERITGSEVQALRQLSERLVHSEPIPTRWVTVHDQFHDFVCDVAGQKHLLQEIRRVRAAVQPYLLMFFQDYRDREMTGDEHKALIDALATRNGALAEQTFAHHVMAAGAGAVAFMRRRQLQAEGPRPARGARLRRTAARP